MVRLMDSTAEIYSMIIVAGSLLVVYSLYIHSDSAMFAAELLIINMEKVSVTPLTPSKVYQCQVDNFVIEQRDVTVQNKSQLMEAIELSLDLIQSNIKWYRGP
jgi:hypothetical protein